jgi:hypothetical protein
MDQLEGGPGGVCQTAAAGSVQNIPFVSQTGTFSMEVDLTPGANGMDGQAGLALGPQTKSKGMACAVRFNSSGTIDALDGKRYTAGTIPYEAGARYRVRFAVDLTAHRYSVFVSPVGGQEETVGVDLAFRKRHRGKTSLDTLVLAANAGSLEACDPTPADAEALQILFVLHGSQRWPPQT